MMQNLFGRFRNHETDGEWLSVSDLMSGLMVIFLFIAIVFIRPLTEQRERVREIAIVWQETEAKIHQALKDEFEDDLPDWNAELSEEDLRIRFKAPEVLFERGESIVSKEFKDILDNFFPRYVGVLEEFKGNIAEIRIEGHTSSEWGGGANPLRDYFENMRLSQDRTRAVLEYTLSLENVANDREWVRLLMTANGLSSSRTIKNGEGDEDAEASRRVEFQVRSKVRTQIIKILEEIQ